MMQPTNAGVQFGAPQSIEALTKNLYSISIPLSITGIERETETTDKTALANNGQEVRKRVIETTADVTEAKRANKLAGTLRSLVDRHGFKIGDSYLTDAAGKAAFEAEFASALAQVQAHNAKIVNGVPQPCKVLGWRPPGTRSAGPVRAVVRTIGLTLEPQDVQDVFVAVTAGLEEARDMLNAGRFDELCQWLKRGQRLSMLLPGLNQNAIANAIDKVRDARTEAAKRMRELNLEEAVERGEKTAIDDCLKIPEVTEAREALDIALGWVTPATPVNPGVTATGT